MGVDPILVPIVVDQPVYRADNPLEYPQSKCLVIEKILPAGQYIPHFYPQILRKTQKSWRYRIFSFGRSWMSIAPTRTPSESTTSRSSMLWSS